MLTTTKLVDLMTELKKGAEENPTTRLLVKPTQDDTKPERVRVRPGSSESLNQPRNTAEDRRNRRGGGAAGEDRQIAQNYTQLMQAFTERQNPESAINCAKPLVAQILKGQLTVEEINQDVPGAAEIAATYLMAKNGGSIDYRQWNGGTRNVPKNTDQLELHAAQQRVLKSMLQYDDGLEDISDPMGVTAQARAQSRAISKVAGEPLPVDSYESAGDIIERQRAERLNKSVQPNMSTPLPWYLRNRR